MEDETAKKTLSRPALILVARTLGGVFVVAGLLPFVAAFDQSQAQSTAFRGLLAVCFAISLSQTLARGWTMILDAEAFADNQIAEHEDD